MYSSILKKEWNKTKVSFFVLLIFIISFLINFYFDLTFNFSTTEPKSMLWYAYVTLEQKPYNYLSILFYLSAIIISIFQFIPEKLKNKIKIIMQLPTSLNKILGVHIFIGIFYLSFLCLIISIILIFILSFYYPSQIVFTAIKDFLFYYLGAILFYLGISSAIIERNNILAIGKLLITCFIILIFHKQRYNHVDLLWLIVALSLYFLLLDSFYSIKQQRIQNIFFKLLNIVSLLIICFFSYKIYLNKYSNEFNKYYIFYSPIKKQFVYQKNYGKHHFEYGNNKGERFNEKQYKNALPFVYWRDLDIQKKLPIKIDNKFYDKKTIKKARLSFSYKPEYLKRQELDIYPLLNPNSRLGRIKFPDEMISFKNNSIKVYSFDKGLDKKLSGELAQLINKNRLSFPIKNIWGKSTNMKPFDLGYFILDSKNKLFRLNRANNKMFLQKISYSKNIEIKFIKISENKQQKLAGYLIDKNNAFYLIDYKTFKLKKLELKNFDYKTMKLQLISNSKYYLIRYSNKHSYFAIVFNKQFKEIDKVVFK